MSAVNDTQKKTTVHEEEMVVINGRKMLLMPDGTLVPMKKKHLFNRAAERLNEQVPAPQNHNVTMADMLAQKKQNG